MARPVVGEGRLQVSLEPHIKKQAIINSRNERMTLTAYIEMLILNAPRKKGRPRG